MESFSAAQRAFAEAIGTALLVFIGAGSVPAILLLESGTDAPFSGADLGFISFAFGLIIAALVYALGKVSGLSTSTPPSRSVWRSPSASRGGRSPPTGSPRSSGP